PLPFKSDMKYVVTTGYPKIKETLTKGSKQVDSMIIDDAGYLITDEFMRKGAEKGYTKFTEMANNFYELISFIQFEMDEDKIVYLVMHEEENDLGTIKPKTIGKMLDEKVCVEGLFTIVLRARKTENEYVFSTQTDGYDVAKTPMEMFDKDEIDNDLKMVDDTIREYYDFKEVK
ncbi:MAG: hypothetical protein PF487_11785, partial [Bacteroidales bacterium]|nr:hypothetical protein [Bacteroidales bacterium]